MGSQVCVCVGGEGHMSQARRAGERRWPSVSVSCCWGLCMMTLQTLYAGSHSPNFKHFFSSKASKNTALSPPLKGLVHWS